MVTIRGKLIDPWHVELRDPVPPGEEAIQVRLTEPDQDSASETGLLVCNPAFDFLRDEPDLYE